VSTALALLAAAFVGSSDFVGGFAARRVPSALVAIIGQGAGFLVVLAALIVLPGVPSKEALAWGAAGGVGSGLGMVVFYRAMGRGAMAVVSSAAALAEGGLPVAVGLGLGERPALVAWLGVAAGLASVPLLTWRIGGEGAAADGRPHTLRSAAIGLLAGCAFGFGLVCLARAPHDSGVWPIAATRMCTMSVVAAALAAYRGSWQVRPSALRLAWVGGLLQVAASVCYLLAVRQGQLVIVAVLFALYPAMTVLLSITLLREHMRPRQLAGVALALLAVALIALR
jgi:drug/metabolite transporter (DMT)-like permease